MRATYHLSTWGFLRALGLIYAVAFLSLWPQLIGLIGHDGILPATHLLQLAHRRLGLERYWLIPTVCWIHCSDLTLYGLCVVGVVLSVFVVVDLAIPLALVGLWILYLSFVSIGQDFLQFQWDNLLLETGFLAIWLTPPRLRSSLTAPVSPTPTVMWLLRWLLFRLMISSGIVKLASGDPVWRNLTALMFHYETQPLPTWIGWYAHQLAPWIQRACCAAMFGIELIVPWLIWGPPRLRRLAAAILIGFQLLIIATGNYGFFNLLTIALCVLLFDDECWPAAWRHRMEDPSTPARSQARWPAWVLVPLVGIIGLVTSVQMSSLFGARQWPRPFIAVVRAVSPFRTINGYGLFAVMTTTRDEIVLEGSEDGTDWRPYEFVYKPGDLSRPPRFVAPHQPRVDWQMWFAVLDQYQHVPWFFSFCQRLLEGSPPVLNLLATNPFPRHPPRYLRAVVYQYQFTDRVTKRAHGTWWRREPKGLYCPVMSLTSS